MLLLYFFINFVNLLVPKNENGICNQSNTSFLAGEHIRYVIYYNVIGLYVNAGRADFQIQASNYNGQEAFTFTATGRSNSKYDWIFKVRDKYESIVDAKTLLPYQFSRFINEGSFHQKDFIQFNQKNKTAIVNSNSYPIANDCTYDVISTIYAARNMNFSNLQVGDKVYLNFFLDKDLYPSYFKFLGKETVTTQYGTFKAIKLAPLLIKGSMFKEAEKMIIWITDDANHVPIRIETPIIVGSIKVDMVGYENLRYPLNALVELAQ